MRQCPAAFNQLYLHSSGKVYPCSFLQNDFRFELGDITNESLERIWESEKLAEFRKIHFELSDSSRCCSNQKKYLCDKLNTRSFYNDDKKMKRVDIMVDSFCNLTCVMCTNIYDKTGGFKHEFFWENNDELLQSLTEIELVGGEPLISPHFFRLAEKVHRLSPSCQWKVTTNGNYPLTPRLKEALSKLNFTTFAVSLDSFKKDVFETIRKDSTHELVMKNIDLMSSFLPSFSINTVVQKLNYTELFDMYQWTKDRGFKFYPILLTSPEPYSLLTLPAPELEGIILDMMEKNQKLQSIEIFFLIRKMMMNSSLKNSLDVLSLYQEHILDFKEAHA